MAAILNANLFVLSISFSCFHVLFCTVSAQLTSARRCRWNQLTILRPKGVECLNCPECPEGHGLVPQCGSRITADVSVECVQCEEGKGYSDKHDFSSCKPCTICDPNEETISPCTATQNAVCGKCNAGYYRAITGDCHPCSWCCADSKDDDKEKQCSEQTGLSANQVCRYDVSTIKCAPRTNSTTTHAHAISAATKPAYSEGAMAYGGKMEIMSSGIWLVALVGVVVLAVCVLIGILYFNHQKNKFLFQLCVPRRPTQAISDPPSSSIVFGRKSSDGQTV